MAEAAATVDKAPPAAGKSRKLLFAGIAVAVLALAGGAAYYFLSHKAPADDTKVAEKTPKKHPVYMPLDTFTVNLHDAENEHFLQTIINLELADAATMDALKQQMPSVRNRILLLLSGKTSQDLMPREGKEKLAVEIATELRKTLEGAGPNKGLEQVLFSHFVIQ
jgi:flagellar protein FliL